MADRRTWQGRLTAVTAALATLLLLAPEALAAPAAALALFADAPATGALPAPAKPTVVRQRLVRVDLGLLLDADGSPRGGSDRAIGLNLFDDASFTALLDEATSTSPVGHAWSGRLDGVDFGSVVLVVERDAMAGQITMPGAVYQIRSAGGGLHVVSEIDQSRFPAEAPPVAVPAEEAAPDADAADGDTASDDGSQVDVLVLYTAAARAAAGGTAAMDAEVGLAIATANTTYANSGIAQRLRLVYKGEIAYTETGAIDTDLARLTSASDGYMDSAHVLRNTYRADLVALIVENGGAACGIANLMTVVSSTFAPSGFSVTDRECASANYSFPHELGHNMSARHDWYVDPTNNSPYTYNHGYVNTAARWRTAMAYNNRCADLGFTCTRLAYWSNPSLTYGGAPMGVPEGTAQAADNRKTLNNTAFTVANFRAAVATPPAATLVSPSGSIGAITPTYRWNAVGTATYYYLWVNGPSGAAVITRWYSAAEAGCGAGAGTCAVTPPTALGAGAHTWWVLTWNAVGYGPWSAPLFFTVAAPPAATLLSPWGSISDATPMYRWNAVAGATWYYLWVSNAAGTAVITQWYTAADAGCGAGAGVCAVTPATVLSLGTHTWWILTWNPIGYGPWSAPLGFSVTAVAPPAATLISPSGATTDNTPTYRWYAVSNATWYYVWVENAARSVAFANWYTAADAGCGAGTGVCSVTPGTALAPGSYTWWILTNNAAGNGPWSAPLSFSVTALTPAAATLVSPSGTISDSTPTYTWNAVSNASWYYLWVSNAAGTAVITQWYTAADAGCGAGVGICSATPTTALALGPHTWWILTWNSFGNGPWSAPRAFTVAALGFNSQFNGSAPGWFGVTGAWSIVNSAFLYTEGVANASSSALYDAVYANFDYQAAVWRNGCQICAVRLWVRGTPFPLQSANLWYHGYTFQIRPDRYFSVWRNLAGVQTPLQGWTFSAAINGGSAWNVLRVVASGGSFAYYINGVLVWSGFDGNLGSGQVGVGMHQDGSFDNRLWVDWAILTPTADALPDRPSPEQQAANDAANRAAGGKGAQGHD